MELKKLKKSKVNGFVAARVSSKTMDLLKKNKINISLAIREHLDWLASEVSKKKAS
jgi:hypothetical protein